jgi:hypothetical protein
MHSQAESGFQYMNGPPGALQHLCVCVCVCVVDDFSVLRRATCWDVLRWLRLRVLYYIAPVGATQLL